jgi:predicted nucleotidyltransferase
LIPYGSRTYGTYKPTSDYDYVCITKNKLQVSIIKEENVDINVWSQDEFIERLQDFHIETLENLYCPESIIGDKFLLLQQNNLPPINKLKLRKNVSTIGSRCVHYAKLLWRDGNYNKAKKNLTHAYRFTLFGLQIVETGRIHDYRCANNFLRKYYWLKMKVILRK